jgi:hypothetical protein
VRILLGGYVLAASASMLSTPDLAAQNSTATCAECFYSWEECASYGLHYYCPSGEYVCQQNNFCCPGEIAGFCN